MDTSEFYHWDLYGYLVVRDVLTATQVQQTRNALDHNKMYSAAQDNASTKENLLALQKPYSEPFLDLMIHPTLVKRLNVLCGKGFRLDDYPIALDDESGWKQFLESENALPLGFGYNYQNGRSFIDYIGVIWFLSDASANTEESVLSIFPGRHKLNYPLQETDTKDGISPMVFHPGDMLIYTKGKQVIEQHSNRRNAPFCAVHYSYTPRSIMVHARSEMLQPETWWGNGEFLHWLTAEERVVMFGPGSPVGSDISTLSVDEIGTVRIKTHHQYSVVDGKR